MVQNYLLNSIEHFASFWSPGAIRINENWLELIWNKIDFKLIGMDSNSQKMKEWIRVLTSFKKMDSNEQQQNLVVSLTSYQ